MGIMMGIVSFVLGFAINLIDAAVSGMLESIGYDMSTFLAVFPFARNAMDTFTACGLFILMAGLAWQFVKGITSLSDKIEGMAYDSDDTHMFPLKGYSQPNLSSAYGPRDFVADSWHTGIDFAAPTGTEILAAADGVVLFIAQMPNGFGNYIVVYHGEQNGQPVSTMYAHMAAFGSYRAGDRINAGDTVGYVGSTGLSTGPHLHFQLHVGNNVRNPVEFFDFLDYLRP